MAGTEMGKMFGYGEIKLFAGSASLELAQEISAYLKVPLSGYDLVEFSNENLFVRLHGSVRGQDVYVIQSMGSPLHRNIMELLIMIDCLKRDSAGRITAVIPYMAYARSDKKDQPRVSIAARLLSDMIEVAGADRYMTVDLHAGQIQGFFSIPGDVGFAKKGRNFAAKLGTPLAFVEKRRTGNDSRATATTIIGDVVDKNVILVDDEVLTASSIVEGVRIVKEHGARDVYLSFTHALLVPPALERLAEAPIVEIVTTNTLALPPAPKLPNLTVLSVAPLLSEVIIRAHEGRSVGELFNE